MAAKPLTHEEIANTEKKLDMPLDDIIKMSKNATNKTKKQKRVPNKSLKSFNNAAQDKALKVRRYMDTRPFVRQGFLAQRRSNFQGNQFPVTTEVARKAAVAPLHNRHFDRNMRANAYRARVGASMVQKMAENGSNAAKQPPAQQQKPWQQGSDGGAKQRSHQTLDSLFANMKEQRMRRVLPWQNNAIQQHRGNTMRPMVPWARRRFGN